jgi:hypothetical protein
MSFREWLLIGVTCLFLACGKSTRDDDAAPAGSSGTISTGGSAGDASSGGSPSGGSPSGGSAGSGGSSARGGTGNLGAGGAGGGSGGKGGSSGGGAAQAGDAGTSGGGSTAGGASGDGGGAGWAELGCVLADFQSGCNDLLVVNCDDSVRTQALAAGCATCDVGQAECMSGPKPEGDRICRTCCCPP